MYWKMLKSSVSKKNKCNLATRDFQTYFQSVNDPKFVFYHHDDGLHFNDRYVYGELDIIFAELNLLLQGLESSLD